MPNESPPGEFADFARAHTPALLRAAYLLTGDQHLAEDLVQSALARTLRGWHRVESPNAYVRKTMYHLQVRWWRKRARTKEIETWAAPVDLVRDSSDDVVRQLALREALLCLPQRQRAVVVLRFYEDRSVEETAELLGCRPGTVKSQTAKALAGLRRRLDRDANTDNPEWSIA